VANQRLRRPVRRRRNVIPPQNAESAGEWHKSSVCSLSPPMYMGCSARRGRTAPISHSPNHRNQKTFAGCGADVGWCWASTAVGAELQRRGDGGGGRRKGRARAAVEEKGALACRTLKDAAAAAAASPLARSVWREGTRALPISALAPALYPIISPLLHVNHVEWKLASERTHKGGHHGQIILAR
jgi:hypothetical protein